MTDIMNIKAETHRPVEILHPGTGEKIGIRINVVHIDDERLMKIKRKITDRRLYLEARGKVFKAEEIEENRIDLLVAAITGWEWYEQAAIVDDTGKTIKEAVPQPTLNGEVPEFSPRAVKAIISNPQFNWITDQVNEAIGETKAFFTQSATN